MPYFQMWRALCQDVDRAFKRMENVSKMVEIASTQMIPKVHDRLAATERKIKNFDPMLEQWECGELIAQKVVEKIVEVPVAGAVEPPQRKKQKPRKEVDYEMYQQVQRLTDEGLGIQRIGKLLGISKQTVSNIRNMSPERVEHLRRVHEGTAKLYDNRKRGMAKPLSAHDIKKIQDTLDSTPDMPVSRLSVLTGISEYRLKKYLAQCDVGHAAINTTPRRRGRKSRKTFVSSDALPDDPGKK